MSQRDLAVTKLYGKRQDALAVRTAKLVEAVFAELGDYDRADIARFVKLTNPHIAAGAKASRGLTAAYLKYMTGVQVATGTELLSTFEAEGPFLKYWRALKEGQPAASALEAGKAYAKVLGHDVVVVEADLMGQSTKLKRVGWRRVLRSDSCKYCKDMSRRKFGPDDRDVWRKHRNCDCLVVPVYGDRDPGAALQSVKLAAET